ncbi:MAG: tetratricopeptide repeat protein [Salinibacter sp.]
MLKVRLLGDFHVQRDDGSPVEIRNSKTRALFQILIGDRGHPFSKDRLIEWLWPDSELGSAEANLRGRVQELRQLLEPDLERGTESHYIQTVREGYRFSQHADCDVDAEAFERHLNDADRRYREGALAEARSAYERAVECCDGDYLPDAPYEDWALDRREHWRRRHLAALERLAELNVRLGDLPEARGHCLQVLEQDPHRESAWRQLMQVDWAAGERTEALRAYERCRETLREARGELPSSATQTLHERIREGLPMPELESMEASASERSDLEAPQAGELPLVGRDAELHEILERLRQTRAGRGGMTLVAGEAGVGKTRLIQDVLNGLSRDEWRILAGRFPDLETPPALMGLANALRDGLADGQIEPQALEDLPTAWAGELAEWLPELAPHLPEPSSTPTLPSELKRWRLFEALSQLLLTLASQKPLLLFLDDLHLADTATLDWLKMFTPQAEKVPLLVLGTARIEEAQGALETLRREGKRRSWLRERQLDRLNADAVEALTRHLSDQPELAQLLTDCTQGNPFFITATIGFMVEQGLLRAGPDEGRWELTTTPQDPSELVPPEAQEVLRQRLAHLQQAERELLYLAATFGATIPVSQLWQAWGGADFDVLEGLCRRHLLVESGNEIAFAHALLREVVYADMSDARRRALHGRIAPVLEATDVAPVWRFHHYRLSDDPAQAVEPGRQALEQARRSYQNEEALRLSEQLLALLEESISDENRRRQLTFEVRSQRFDIFGVMGQRSEQERELDALFELAEQLGDREQCQVHRRRAVVREDEGRMEQAQQDAEEALALAPDEDEQAESQLLLGNFALDTGKLARARDHYQQALGLFESGEDDRGGAQALNNLGIVHYYLGSYDQARSYYDQALDLSRRLGDRREVGKILNNLGDIHGLREDWERAQSCLDESVTVRREIGDRRGELITLANLGELAARRSDSEAARDHLNRAVDLAVELQLSALEAAVRARSAWAELLHGELDAAHSQAQEALAVVEDGRAAEFAPEIYFRAFQVFDEAGSPDRATHVLRKAYEELQDRAESLPEAFQTRFLEGVLTHREILRTYQNRFQPQS